VRTTVGSDLGHTPGMLIEIDCIAYRANQKGRRSKPPSKKKTSRTGARPRRRSKRA
jgi:hypothetical protein